MNNYNNEIKLNSKRLLDIILDDKNKDSDSILFLINKYKPLIIKYSISYILKNYDKINKHKISISIYIINNIIIEIQNYY